MAFIPLHINSLFMFISSLLTFIIVLITSFSLHGGLTGAGGEDGRRGGVPGEQRVKTDHVLSVRQQRLQGDVCGVGRQGAL